jgi:hypothetical protein
MHARHAVSRSASREVVADRGTTCLPYLLKSFRETWKHRVSTREQYVRVESAAEISWRLKDVVECHLKGECVCVCV